MNPLASVFVWSLIAHLLVFTTLKSLKGGLHCCDWAGLPGLSGDITIVITLKVPKTGGLPTTKVNVVRWLKREGQHVTRGEAVVELETEKVNYELDSPADGTLLKILTKEGAEVPVGDPVCHIGQQGDAIPE